MCSACKRRRLDCEYGEQAGQAPCTPDSVGSGVAAGHTGSNSSPASTSASTSPIALGIGETDLLQHYLHHTIKTFKAVSIHSQKFWRTVVPALGYRSCPVRLGMLTAAAICLHNDTKSSDPDQSLNYLRAAEHYGVQFVGTSSQQLRRLETGDADVHLTCSRLLTILAFAFFRIYQQYDGVTIVDAKAWNWLHLLRGSSTVHQHYRDTPGALANELAAEVPAAGIADAYKLNPHFQLIERTRQERFAALYDSVSTRSRILGDDQAAEVYSAVRALEDITEDICSGQVISLMRSLCTWPCRISKGFAGMLIGGDLLALAVHAHWLMLVVLAEDVWFMGNMGRAGIWEITDLCDAVPAANVERSLLDWSRQMLGDYDGHGALSDSL